MMLKMSDKSKNNLELTSSLNNIDIKLLDLPFPLLFIKRDKFSRYILAGFNEFAQEIFAVPLNRLINKELRIIWPRDSWDAFRKGIVKAMRKNEITDVGSIVIEKDGKERSFSIKIWSVDSDLVCCVFYETIDKMFFTKSVLDEKLKYEELFKHTPVMMLNINLDGKIIEANLNWIQKTGYDRNELLGKFIQDFLILDFKDQKKLNELIINNELINYPAQLKKKNGEFIDAVITARPLFDINGKFIRCYFVAHDVSELREIKEEYENTEKLLKSLLDNSNAAILIFSFNRGIIECNQKAIDLFHSQGLNLQGKNLSDLDLFKNLKLNRNETSIEKIVEQGIDRFEFSRRTDEGEKYFEVALTRVTLKNEPLLIIFITDKSTERKKDEIIKESEGKFQTLFQESNDALKLLDENGRVLMMNKKASEIFGKFIDENGFIKLKSKDFDYNQSLKKFISSNETVNQLEYKLNTGSNTRIFDERNVKVNLSSGEKIILSTARDITNEKISLEELHKREQRLKNLNDVKNRLIYILSHDLRAPTASIIGMVNAILEEPQIEQKDLVNYLNLIRSSASYQLDLINNLLDWSLLESGRFNYSLEPKNLRYAVYHSLNSIHGLLSKKNITLDVKVDSETVLIDLNLFNRILINLVSNAIKFSYPKSKIWIRTKPISKNRIQISVKDSGIGIDKEALNKLFTFKEKVSRIGTLGERGTGLGLSLCKDIVQILGGKLTVKSPVLKSNKKSSGTEVLFDVRIVEPKIFVSKKLSEIKKKDLLQKPFQDFKLIQNDFKKYLSRLIEDYHYLIVIDEKEFDEKYIGKILEFYKTSKNIIIVGDNSKDNLDGFKKIKSEDIVPSLQNELHKIKFELDQQQRIASDLKKMWE